jgi:sugar phosphate isomerase/epimerase
MAPAQSRMLPAKAVHSWSLFRTLGRFVAPDSMPSGDLPERVGDGLALLDLPAELARHGFRSVQLCHFYLPTRDNAYLDELRAAFNEADVELECFLVDDGDLTDPSTGDANRDWISDWIETGRRLQPARVRVVAGKQPPTAENVAASAVRLIELADRHPVRLVVENWHGLLTDAGAVNQLLDRTEGRIGLLIDLGNWTGPGKYAQLAAVAARAETCQAKVTTDQSGRIDVEDYRRSLTVLRDAGYDGPLAIVHDGPDPAEWTKLDEAYEIVCSVWGRSTAAERAD